MAYKDWKVSKKLSGRPKVNGERGGWTTRENFGLYSMYCRLFSRCLVSRLFCGLAEMYTVGWKEHKQKFIQMLVGGLLGVRFVKKWISWRETYRTQNALSSAYIIL